ncbi:hypothetical protein HDF18_15825 [Mucilaginibacter sp. X5P1]|uniref:hypothetical protein n=1 Tax=Mucilaginibacter sp. X5P1 TaxID=2723088 RepID=UPI0016076EAC|nr:hypothetical protein [Mucilaginibacter sp. X5P1]MBB6139091.1 hypothetical protein [Mucilaginibacter sp. X5P1]
MTPFFNLPNTYGLDTKSNQKNQVSRLGFFAAQASALPIRQNLGCYIFTLLSLRAWPLRFCKNLLCPATHKATIVLPDFIRSCSTDELHLISPKERAQIETLLKAGKGSTKSAGLGVLPVGGRIFLS